MKMRAEAQTATGGIEETGRMFIWRTLELSWVVGGADVEDRWFAFDAVETSAEAAKTPGEDLWFTDLWGAAGVLVLRPGCVRGSVVDRIGLFRS
jgi:hypothetical protein